MIKVVFLVKRAEGITPVAALGGEVLPGAGWR
jgi:hypothetical protein